MADEDTWNRKEWERRCEGEKWDPEEWEAIRRESNQEYMEGVPPSPPKESDEYSYPVDILRKAAANFYRYRNLPINYCSPRSFLRTVARRALDEITRGAIGTVVPDDVQEGRGLTILDVEKYILEQSFSQRVRTGDNVTEMGR